MRHGHVGELAVGPQLAPVLLGDADLELGRPATHERSEELLALRHLLGVLRLHRAVVPQQLLDAHL